jgi:hypothetical protein
MCDVPCNITPLLTSFSPSEGPDIQGAVSIGHPGVVIGDMAHSSGLASFVRDVALLLSMPNSITEQALIDMRAVVCRVPIPLTLLALFMILFGAMLLPICKVVEAGIEHGLWDVRGHQGIVEDVWLKAAKGIGMGQGT